MCYFFFFNDTATTEIYTLSLHDALPIFPLHLAARHAAALPLRPVDELRLEVPAPRRHPERDSDGDGNARSEEHTSELQSRQYLVCRLLLEKKKKKQLTILIQ